MLVSILGTTLLSTYPDNSEVKPNIQGGEIIGYTPKQALTLRTEPSKAQSLDVETLPQPSIIPSPFASSGLGFGPAFSPSMNSITSQHVGKVFTVDEFRDIKISALKRYSKDVIESQYPMFKQMNIIRQSNNDPNDTSFTEMTNFIDNCRNQSTTHEEQLKGLNDYESIGAYNIYINDSEINKTFSNPNDGNVPVAEENPSNDIK